MFINPVRAPVKALHDKIAASPSKWRTWGAGDSSIQTGDVYAEDGRFVVTPNKVEYERRLRSLRGAAPPPDINVIVDFNYLERRLIRRAIKVVTTFREDNALEALNNLIEEIL